MTTPTRSPRASSRAAPNFQPDGGRWCRWKRATKSQAGLNSTGTTRKGGSAGEAGRFRLPALE